MDTSTLENLIERNSYRGIRDQDGWETLELTVRDEQPDQIAEAILLALREG